MTKAQSASSKQKQKKTITHGNAIAAVLIALMMGWVIGYVAGSSTTSDTDHKSESSHDESVPHDHN